MYLSTFKNAHVKENWIEINDFHLYCFKKTCKIDPKAFIFLILIVECKVRKIS